MNKFPGQDSRIQVAVVGKKKAKDGSSNQTAFPPLEGGGDNFDPDDLMLSNLLSSPTGFMQQASAGGMDPGTPVFIMKELGALGGVIFGQTNTINKGSESGDSSNLDSAKQVTDLKSTKRNINIAPDIKEVGGKRIIMEKGKQHSLDLLDGLPIHGALFDMAGFRLPEIKKVNTAKQKNTGMMSLEQLQQMMGQIMSLGQMIQGLAGNKGGGGGPGGFGAGGSGGGSVSTGTIYVPPGANTGAGGLEYGGGLGNNIISAVEAPANTAIATVMESLSPPMKTALNSLSVLLQGYEAQDGVSFFTGDVVHEETFLQNAQDLLSKVGNMEDLMGVLSRLQWDKSLHGTEKLANVVTQIETAWGTALQEIDVNGNIVLTYGTEDAKFENDFANNMYSNTSSPSLGFFGGDDPTISINATNYTLGGGTTPDSGGGGASPASGGGGGSGAAKTLGQVQGLLGQVQGLAQGLSKNMFGESAGTMKDMWKRMTREQENDARQMHQKLNDSGDIQDMTKIVKQTLEGGNPADPKNLKPDMLESLGDTVGQGNFGVGFMQ